MTDLKPGNPAPQDDVVTIKEVLRENPILARSLIFLVFMLLVPVFLAWKYDLFLVAN